MHSLDEDDRSVSAHTTNLNALSPRASKSTSPTAVNVVGQLLLIATCYVFFLLSLYDLIFFNQEFTSNGPTSLTEHREISPAVSFVPENQSAQFHSPEKESRETDALLATRS